MGRVRMQIMGFTWMFVLFLCSAVAYNKLTMPGALGVDKPISGAAAVQTWFPTRTHTGACTNVVPAATRTHVAVLM